MPAIDFTAAGSDHLQLARSAWSAWTSSTPERWASLVDEDLSPLPHLRRTVNAMLDELPDERSGLAASERLALSTVASGPVACSDLQRAFQNLRPAVLNYWEVGKLIDMLAEGGAMDGLGAGPFDLRLHNDEKRWKAYREGRLGITSFGRALLEGEADWPRCNPIERWWGGVHLCGTNIWRWNAQLRTLTHPAVP